MHNHKNHKLFTPPTLGRRLSKYLHFSSQRYSYMYSVLRTVYSYPCHLVFFFLFHIGRSTPPATIRGGIPFLHRQRIVATHFHLYTHSHEIHRNHFYFRQWTDLIHFNLLKILHQPQSETTLACLTLIRFRAKRHHDVVPRIHHDSLANPHPVAHMPPTTALRLTLQEYAFCILRLSLSLHITSFLSRGTMSNPIKSARDPPRAEE